MAAPSQPTGVGKMTGEQVRAAFTGIRVNQEVLDACPYHSFSEAGDEVVAGLPLLAASRRPVYVCTACGGVISQSSYAWHELGRRPPVGSQPS